MTLSHRIRLRPTVAQRRYFARACGTARFAYNWGLAEWKRAYAAGEKPNGRALKVRFNALRKAELPWTYEVHRDCTARPFDNLQRAFVGFFRGTTRHPSFKRKGEHDSFYCANDKIEVRGKRVRIPVLGWVRMREALRFDWRILGATVSRDADAWEIALHVEGDFARERTGDGTVGVDLGLTTLATLSTGEKVAGPKALRSSLKRLRRTSRAHSRKVRGSANRKKAARRLARCHRRIANVRNDACHQLTARLCRENQAIGIETLNVAGMVRNRRLSRAIGDAGWGKVARQLGYKALLYDSLLVEADRFFPSSRRCSRCGVVKATLALSERVFRCAACGLVKDRDVNAALNLEQLARATREAGAAPTPVKTEALARRHATSETMVAEAGTLSCSLLST